MKIKSLITLSLFSLFTKVYAGSMGPASTDMGSLIKPFVSVEGAYIWNAMYAGAINGFQSNRNNDPWGGRAAGGFALQRTENLRYSTEVGWGSYGNNRFSTIAGESASYYFYGFDVLLGAVYSYGPVDFFAKAGAMIETLRGQAKSNLGEYYPGGLYSGQIQEFSSQTTALPELKVGAEYNFNKDLSLSLAYMYAFGNDSSLRIDNNASAGGIKLNQQLHFQGPSFNSIMLGMRYYI